MIEENEWSEIDPYIFANDKLPAVKLLFEKFGSLKEGMKAFYERYAMLRKSHPEKFNCTEQEYWAGFDS